MKTKEDLLKFYGVELGKTYIVTKTAVELADVLVKYLHKKFQVNYSPNFRFFNINFEKGLSAQLQVLNNLDYVEFNESILDSAERKYLSAVIKPFRKDVICIEKTLDIIKDREFITIYLKNSETIWLPYFEKGTMYKGMQEEKIYSLEELGL